MTRLVKYPRTRHLEGSRLQPGDEDLEQVTLAELRGRPLVIEEKLDGANAALSCDRSGELLLQSRGHFLRGGRTERQFDLFKTWATTHSAAWRRVLGKRYVVFGEWLYAKHTIFYDRLPHYFMEFDVYDREQDVFLSTPRRHALLAELKVEHVPVLETSTATSPEELRAKIEPALYKSADWREGLRAAARERSFDVERIERETDASDLAEGLYLKWEEEGVVRGRYKFIRRSFLQAVADSGSHWADRPVLPNGLAPGVELFA
jgi:ATP-dependent RNA circularization protein (DNA/RNA ligase family)